MPHQLDRTTHFSVLVFTNGTFALTSFPALFIAAAAAAALTSIGEEVDGPAEYVNIGTGPGFGGLGEEDEAGLEETSRDKAAFAPEVPADPLDGPLAAGLVGCGVPVRDELGVHECDCVDR